MYVPKNYLDIFFWTINFENLMKVMTSFQVNQSLYQVLQTIQMKLILLCVWAEQAVLGSAKTALKFKYEI